MLPAYLAVAATAAAYFVARNLEPLIAGAIFLIGGLALPWLTQMSRRFAMANTSNRGHRFHFLGGPADAYAAYLIRPVLLTILTFGFAGRCAEEKRREYFFDNVGLGHFESHAELRTGFFYSVVFIGGIFLASLGFFGSAGTIPFSMAIADGSASPPHPWVIQLSSWIPYLVGLAYGVFVKAMFVDHCWDNTSFASDDESSNLHLSLHSRMDAADYLWIVATNAILAAVVLDSSSLMALPVFIASESRGSLSRVAVTSATS